MIIKWTSSAQTDVARLYDFLSLVNPAASARVVQVLTKSPDKLVNHPRLGERLEEFNPREVRHIFPGEYEMRYEVSGNVVYVLRIWHTRERRSDD